jgi:hypothetical protein
MGADSWPLNFAYILFALLTGVSGFCFGLLFGRRSHKEMTNFWMQHVHAAMHPHSDPCTSHVVGQWGDFLVTSSDAVSKLRSAIENGLRELAKVPPGTEINHSTPQQAEFFHVLDSVFEGSTRKEAKARISAAATAGDLLVALKWILAQLERH